MRKIKFMALLLTAILTILSVAPTAVYAEEVTEGTAGSEESEETAVSVPYSLRTEQVNEYDANKVRVWLELDPTRAESISSYQISIQLKDSEGSAVAGRGMTLKFDEALDKAQIKESVFDPETQIMKIYVAASENLVQFEKDSEGNASNILPIGIVSVDKIKGEKNMFRIDLSDNDGDLVTVDTGMNTVDVAEEFGVDFVIPVDGVTYGEPLNLPLGIRVEGKGAVKAYIVKEDGETPVEGKIYEGSTVRLSAIPAQGYRLKSLVLIDERNKENEITLDGNFKFEMESVIGVRAAFEEIDEKYTVKVGANASILGTAEKEKEFNARAAVTVLAKAPEGKKFSCWKNEEGAVVSYKETYSFVVTANVKLTPEFIDLDQEKTEDPFVVLNGGTCAPYNGRYRLSYSCSYSLPKGYQLVQRGIILTNQASAVTTDLENFKLGSTINGVKTATCVVDGTNAQFISNINNVAKNQTRVARAFLTYKVDANSEPTTIYSTNAVDVTTH